MSGQPSNTQSDRNRFRNEYMENLDLEEENNDFNLQSNKTYLLTGQLPPSSQMIDTRTNSEKLADIEKMKLSIAADLKPIAEPAFAIAIVNGVLNSPLNVDNSLFRFLAQRAETIATLLKKSYKYGIAGDANDIQQFVEFVKNMYNEQQGKFQSVKSYVNSTQTSSSTGSSSVISANDISPLIQQFEDLIKNLEIIKGRVGVNPDITQKVYDIRHKLDVLLKVLPTTNEMKLFLDEMKNPGFDRMDVAPPHFSREELANFFTLMEKLPKYSEVISLINKVKQYINSNNWTLVEDGLNRINSLFSVINDENIRILQQFKDIKDRQTLKIRNSNIQNVEQTIGTLRDQAESRADASKANKVYVINPANDPVYTQPGVILPPGAPGAPGGAPPLVPPPATHLARELRYNPPNVPPVFGNGMTKRRGRPRGGGIVKPQPIKIPSFVGFGINEVNQKQLEKCIFKIRRNTGSNYPDMPSKHITKNLQKIIKSIIGGGVPGYNDLGSLDDEEKDYLQKIVSRSNLQDRLSVPAPSKDQMEKDIHTFEVLKGQILSGNDNVDLVKKFKLLVRKLQKSNMLAKSDVDDIIETLQDLGY